MHGSDAVTETPSDAGKALMTFFDPAAICKTDGSTLYGLWNQALIFHEALHGFYGKGDLDVQRALGLTIDLGSTENITVFLDQKILGGKGQPCVYGN